jgi:hypothetical protein
MPQKKQPVAILPGKHRFIDPLTFILEGYVHIPYLTYTRMFLHFYIAGICNMCYFHFPDLNPIRTPDVESFYK